MATIYYRPLDPNNWTLTGSNLSSNGLSQFSTTYWVISPEVINTLGGTPSSTIAAATLQTSDIKQSVFDPQRPAADFALSNWNSKSWPDASSNMNGFQLAVRDWVSSNLDNASLNPQNRSIVFYLVDTTISGTRYLIPIAYLGNDGDILGFNGIQAVFSTGRQNEPGQGGGEEYYYQDFGAILNNKNRVMAWGVNHQNMLGTQGFTQNSAFDLSKVASQGWGQSNVTVVLDQSGFAWSWGDSTLGKLGNLTSGNKFITSSPVSVLGAKIWNKIQVGSENAIAGLDQSGYLWGWGYIPKDLTPAVGFSQGASSPISLSTTRRWLDLAVGATRGAGTGCAIVTLDLSSYAWAWGLGGNGVLGNNSTASTTSPISVVGGRQFRSVFAGSGGNDNTGSGFSGLFAALDLNSYAWAWGYNGFGQLGDGTTINRSSPVSVLGDRQWISLALTGTHITALDSNSYAWCWGNNTVASVDFRGAGALGDGTTVDRSSPVSVIGGRQWAKLASSFGLDRNSYAWAWGMNQWAGTGTGLIGDGTTNHRSSPVSVLGGRQFVNIGSGYSGRFAQDSNGRLFSWGYNPQGTLGNCSVISTSSPVSVVSPLNYSTPTLLLSPRFSRKFWKIACGYRQIVGLDMNSYAWAWGTQAQGSMGNNTNTSYFSSPVSVLGGRQYTDIKVGHALPNDAPGGDPTLQAVTVFAQDGSGFLWSWGQNNSYGQLATNTLPHRSSPASVVGNRRFIAFEINNIGGLALDVNSYAYAWGANINGCLGINADSNAARSSPVSVVGGRQWQKITFGAATGISVTAGGIDSLGYAWCWGGGGSYGNSGSVGNNAATSRSSPVSVVGGRRFRDIVSGSRHVVALDLNSYAWAWGGNKYGQVGDHTTINRSSPVSVRGGIQFDRLQVVWDLSIGIKGSNVYAWGGGDVGAGNPNFANSSPVQISALTTAAMSTEDT